MRRGSVVPAPREGDDRIGFPGSPEASLGAFPRRSLAGNRAKVLTEGAWVQRGDSKRPVRSLSSFRKLPAPIDLSLSDSQPSTAQLRGVPLPDDPGRELTSVADVSCRIIEVLGDEFDFMAFNSQFRVDVQEAGPAHGFARGLLLGEHPGRGGGHRDQGGRRNHPVPEPAEEHLGVSRLDEGPYRCTREPRRSYPFGDRLPTIGL